MSGAKETKLGLSHLCRGILEGGLCGPSVIWKDMDGAW